MLKFGTNIGSDSAPSWLNEGHVWKVNGFGINDNAWLRMRGLSDALLYMEYIIIPDSKVHGANMGPIWGRQDPGGPRVGPINFDIWDIHASILTDMVVLLIIIVHLKYTMLSD